MKSTIPLQREVTRWGCPFCNKWLSSSTRINQHIAGCWKNPNARSCGSCVHRQVNIWTHEGDSCKVGHEIHRGCLPRDCEDWETEDLKVSRAITALQVIRMTRQLLRTQLLDED